MDSVAWLDRLIGFPTVSRVSNLDLIDYVREYLTGLGARTRTVADASGQKANLFATVGPTGPSGILLSGHTDVVPVDGQAWTSDPFRMVERHGLLFGRGATDMKGFLACMLRLAGLAAARKLSEPLHLAFSYDEEIGCVGVRGLLDLLNVEGLRSRLCVVGEPTGMQVVTGHKGKLTARGVCAGVGGHSSRAPLGCNAVYLATDLIQCIRAQQGALTVSGAHDDAYDVPYTTLHVGCIAGGVALNVVPDACSFDFEIRAIDRQEGEAAFARIVDDAAALTAAARRHFPSAGVEVKLLNAYPGLNTPANSEAFATLSALTGDGKPRKVAFGTEGGLFHERLDVPVLVCGPGDLAQAHVADEFISRAELARCDAMLHELLNRLCA
jgi:acetylornithine deacetylase